jgi:hypothetical protein
VQVEVSQNDARVLTWRMNENLIAQRTNNSAFTNGNILLSFSDLFPSIASPAADAFLLYDNVRVELDANALRPVMSLQPTNQTKIVGQTAQLAAQASGLGPLNYQWRRGGLNLANATNNVLTLSNVQVTDQGGYDLVAANAAGNVVSATADLIVIPASMSSPTLTLTTAGSTLHLTWPVDHTGWRLEMQTNSLAAGLGTNWVSVSSSMTNNSITIPIGSAGSAFFRLAYP